jgi:hypothetical protein|nr:MAG TPA: intron associated endonuclease [Crassvirales sp.]
MIGYIYKFENKINGKIYIGKTKNIKERIPIKQFSKDGVFIKQWSSITEAARYYNLPKSCISRVCKNERKSCGGFIWKYC